MVTVWRLQMLRAVSLHYILPLRHVAYACTVLTPSCRLLYAFSRSAVVRSIVWSTVIDWTIRYGKFDVARRFKMSTYSGGLGLFLLPTT